MITIKDSAVIQIQQLCAKKQTNSVTYYELMCRMQLPADMFSNMICDMASQEVIDIDEEGTIRLKENKPERTYTLCNWNGQYEGAAAFYLSKEAATRLCTMFNHIVDNANFLTKDEKKNIKFSVQ